MALRLFSMMPLPLISRPSKLSYQPKYTLMVRQGMAGSCKVRQCKVGTKALIVGIGFKIYLGQQSWALHSALLQLSFILPISTIYPARHVTFHFVPSHPFSSPDDYIAILLVKQTTTQPQLFKADPQHQLKLCKKIKGWPLLTYQRMLCSIALCVIIAVIGSWQASLILKSSKAG